MQWDFIELRTIKITIKVTNQVTNKIEKIIKLLHRRPFHKYIINHNMLQTIWPKLYPETNITAIINFYENGYYVFKRKMHI